MRTILPAIVVVVAVVVIALVAMQPPATVAQTSGRATGTVAVIDLDGIAKTLGRSEGIAEAITAKQTDLNEQLTKAQTAVNDQIKTKQTEFGDTPTAEQSQALQQMRSQGAMKLVQARQQAQQILQKHQSELISKFREEVKPFAQAIAKEQGYQIVLVRNDQLVFTYAASVDISDAVAAKMQAK